MTCQALVVCVLLSLGQPTWKRQIIAEETCKSSVDQMLILSVIQHESRFIHWKRPTATWDWGIMQLHCPPGRISSSCPRCKKKIRCNLRTGIRLIERLKIKCRDRGRGNKYCYPHWIQQYNPLSRGYATRVLNRKKKINEIRKRCIQSFTKKRRDSSQRGNSK